MLGFIFMQIGGPFCGTRILFYFGSFFDLDIIEFEYITVNGGKHGVGVIWVPSFFLFNCGCTNMDMLYT